MLLVDNMAERAEETRAMIREEGGEASVFQADVTLADDCRRMVETAVEHYGRLDILDNNVGISAGRTVVGGQRGRLGPGDDGQRQKHDAGQQIRRPPDDQGRRWGHNQHLFHRRHPGPQQHALHCVQGCSGGADYLHGSRPRRRQRAGQLHRPPD